MSKDPRGPMRIITKVDKNVQTENGQIIRVWYDCGCVGAKAPHRPDAYRVGDDDHAFGCLHA